MYKISVPLVLSENLRKEESLEMLKKCGAERVFVALGALTQDEKKFEDSLCLLREYVDFYKKSGLEVGVWLWTFWRKDIAPEEVGLLLKAGTRGNLRQIETDSYQTGLQGIEGFCCPESELFLSYASKQLERIAACGADMIMFDDDFTYGGFGCFCERHMEIVAQEFGGAYTREELISRIWSDIAFRKKWHRIMGDGLEGFCKRMREAVNRSNPSTRLGFCCVMSNWDTDGSDPVKMAKLLAGDTKPFMRLIGAPYWANRMSWGNRLQHVIELERMEFEWCKGEGIEIMTEGDVFPRPRHRTPAALLEGFDTALRAAGVGDGILKYMIDYTSTPFYETGYVAKHLKNAEIYKNIERIFAGKGTVGVRIFETAKKFDDTDFADIDDPRTFSFNQFFSKEARLLADNSIPTVYGKDMPVGIAFGENARHIAPSDIKGGMIIDIRAARILMERGIDVGIESIGEKYTPIYVYYPDQDDFTLTTYGAGSAYKIAPKKEAKVVSYATFALGKGEVGLYPDSVTYENADGVRFLVFGFDVAMTDETRWRTYAMQRLLFSTLDWLGSQRFFVRCEGNPDLYVQCKKDDGTMAIGLWNFSIDEIDEPTVELDREYRSAEFVGCDGAVRGRELKLSPIAPYSFAFVSLKL